MRMRGMFFLSFIPHHDLTYVLILGFTLVCLSSNPEALQYDQSLICPLWTCTVKPVERLTAPTIRVALKRAISTVDPPPPIS